MSKGTIEVCKIGQADPSADWNFYCGRTKANTPAGMIFANLGNPYWIDDDHSRTMAVAAFAEEFDAGESERSKRWRNAVDWMQETARAGASIRLFCHCKPKACHCDILQGRAILQLIFPEPLKYGNR